jgi:hypothetical protein
MLFIKFQIKGKAYISPLINLRTFPFIVFTYRRFTFVNCVINMCYDGLLIVREISGENIKIKVSYRFNVLFWHCIAGRG